MSNDDEEHPTEEQHHIMRFSKPAILFCMKCGKTIKLSDANAAISDSEWEYFDDHCMPKEIDD